MITKRRFSRIFFGWWTVLVTGIWTGLGYGIYGYGFSVFFKPLAADLGLSRAVASVAAGIGRLEGGIEAPLTGWLVDKYGPRWVIVTSVVIMGAGLVLMYFVNSLWSFYLAWGVLTAFGLNLGLGLACEKALSNWFINKRGLAFAIRFTISGIGGVIMLPVVTWLVTTQGWRMTNLIWGAVIFAGAPLLWFFVKQKRPEYYGLLPDGAAITVAATDTREMIERGVEYAAESAGEVEFTLRQALKTPAYWLLIIAQGGTHLVQGAIGVHIIPFLTDMGIAPVVAGSMMALMVFFTVPARFFAGFITDRVSKGHLNFLLAAVFLFMAVGTMAIVLSQTMVMIYIFLVLYGIGHGASVPLRYIIGSRYFGRKAFGSILGTSAMFMSPLSLIAPVYAGWIYDTTGSYMTALITFAALAAFAASFMLLVRPPRPPAEVTDVSQFI